MTMQIKHLEYLVALSREKHFARAAAACHVTQPTLSAGIKQLEESLGVLIVERGQRFRGFTAQGERVLGWARRILGDVDALQRVVSDADGELVGRLRLGVIPSALATVAQLTGPFTTMNPKTSVTVLSQTSIDIQRGLDDFTLDAGITYLDNEPLMHVRPVPLYREHYRLVTPVSGPAGSLSQIPWRDAADLPLCLLTPDMQNRRIIDGHFRAAGAVVRPRIETNSLITIWTHLRRGGYSSVLPEAMLGVVGSADGLVTIPLVEPDASQSVGLIVPDRDPPTPLAAAFLAVAETVPVVVGRSERRAS
jgi:DNA-binding transcriptional LysR family regulator